MDRIYIVLANLLLKKISASAVVFHNEPRPYSESCRRGLAMVEPK